jgi:hypothetical protein
LTLEILRNLSDLLYVSMDFITLLGEKRRNFLMLVQGWWSRR